MNPIKWLFNNIKEDIEVVIHICKCLKSGEPILDPEKRAMFIAEFKKITPASMIKESWMWLLCIAFAAACAWLVSAKYYQSQCNMFVYENYILPEIEKRIPGVADFMLNMSNFTTI